MTAPGGLRRRIRELRRIAWGWLVLGCLLFVSRPAIVHADPGERVGLVTAQPTGALALAFAGELRAAGFSVVTIPPPAQAPAFAVLRDLARAHEVAATVWFDDGRGAGVLTIWVVDRVTGKMVVRELEGGPPTDKAAAKLAALNGVELLRASLRELEDLPQPPSAEVEPSAPVKRLVTRAPPTYRFDIGGGVSGSAGGVRPAAHVGLGVRFELHRWAGLRVMALVPVVGSRLRDREGYARLTIAQLLAGPHVPLRPPGVVVRPDVGVLVGVAMLQFEGVAIPPLLGRSDRLFTFSAMFDAGLSIRVSPTLRIRADAGVGLAAPELAITFVGRPVGRWGRPFGQGTLGLALGLN